MRHTLHIAAAAVLALALAACGTAGSNEDEEFAYGQYALSEEDGGFTADDGLPAFGEEEMASEQDPQEIPYAGDDADEAEAETQAPKGAKTYILRVAWGQFPANPDLVKPTEWKGFIHARGARLFIQRAVLFEKHDFFKPCIDHRCIFIDSITLPHHDGLVIKVVPTGNAPAGVEPSVAIDFQGLYGRVISLSELDGLAEVTVVDGKHNRVVLNSKAIDHECPTGFLRGVWRRVNVRGGVFAGKFVGDDGAVHGKLAGIWGRRKDGKRVFFGKYVDSDGRFKGILRGVYAPYDSLPIAAGIDGGVFIGRWVDKNGELGGVLRGHYGHAAIPGTAGFFRGMYRVKCGGDGVVVVCPKAVGPDEACLAGDAQVCEPTGKPQVCKCVDKDDGSSFCVCNGCPKPGQPGTCMDLGQCDDTGLGIQSCSCGSDPASSQDQVDCTCDDDSSNPVQ